MYKSITIGLKIYLV